MSQAVRSEQKSGERQVLSGQQEIRAAIIKATANAQKSLAILTPDLEPQIYDTDEFLDCLKRFILARSFARVRVLITKPSRTLKSGNDFVNMGRRLNTYIEFRSMKPELGERHDAFFIADEKAIVYRAQYDNWKGMADPCQPDIARLYLTSFDELWHECAIEPEIRHSQL